MGAPVPRGVGSAGDGTVSARLCEPWHPWGMSPRESTAPAQEFGPHPSDREEVEAAFASDAPDAGIALSPEDIRRLAEDGEWPASLS